MHASDLTALGAVDLARAIRIRAVSCREVMTATLAQIERLNPAATALVSLQDPERLLAEADARDAHLAAGHAPLGPLHGFPQAPKDMAATAGIRTTLGSPLLRDNVPTTDAVSVQRARRAGAILIGKSNTPEFGLGSHTYNPIFGTTRNAFDPTRSAGGSSGGAAVALALHLLPVADGSDMMGSLRNPAGWNNVVGLRPSFGRVPSGPGPEVFVQQLGTEGPMGRTVADLALLLSVQAGHDPRQPLSLDDDPAVFAQPLARDVKGLRIGWLGDLGGYLPMEPGVLDTCRAALAHFTAAGCIVEDATLGFAPERLWRTWLTLRAFLVNGSLTPMYAIVAKRALMKQEAQWEVERGLRLTAADVYRASAERTAWAAAQHRLFETYDALVLPTAQVFPFDAALQWPAEVGGRTMDTYHRWMEVVLPGTLGGGPVLAVPAGFGPTGLPMGLQVMGRPRGDLALLQLGHAYEQASGFAKVRSPLLDR
jgi:amidase